MLKPPVLNFTDTGLSVSDGVTRTGLWSVVPTPETGWEYSLDLGKTWITGEGSGFEVTQDGAQTIWVRARDSEGNVSDIVMVSCVLDTKSPAALSANSVEQSGVTRFDFQGLEQMSVWEYSVDRGNTWWVGSGKSLSVIGNVFPRILVRQMDLAGNASQPTEFNLEGRGRGWREISGNPLAPDVVGETDHTLLVHGEIDRGDADFVRLDIPAAAKLKSAEFTFYQSVDEIAFYAIQRAQVFDAGTDIKKMLVYGHFGPTDVGKNLVQSSPVASLQTGSLTTWINQTGTLKTTYLLQLDVQSDADAGGGSGTNPMTRSLAGMGTNTISSEVVTGSTKLDKFTYNTLASDYRVKIDGSVVTVSSQSSAEVDQLSGVERLRFRDKSIAFDVDGNAGQAYRLYKAAFGRDPLVGDMAGLGYWIGRIDNGMDLVEVASRFIDSNEFRSLYGQSPSNAEFLSKVYTNVLGRSPDQAGFAWWLEQLTTNPDKTRRKVLADFSESLENKQAVASLIGNGIPYVEFAE